MWYQYDDEKTISTKGSEEGIIILDEEFSNNSARARFNSNSKSKRSIRLI